MHLSWRLDRLDVRCLSPELRGGLELHVMRCRLCGAQLHRMFSRNVQLPRDERSHRGGLRLSVPK
jgi:hypothetical protein